MIEQSIEYTKEQLIGMIKELIVSDDSKVDINPNYIEYFEYDELLEIKNELEHRKNSQGEYLNEFLDDIYESCKQ